MELWVTITPATSTAQQTVDQVIRRYSGTLEPVPGLGDAAVYSGGATPSQSLVTARVEGAQGHRRLGRARQGRAGGERADSHTGARQHRRRHRWPAGCSGGPGDRAGIEAAMWRKYAARAGAIRCDDSFPDRQRVGPRTRLPQRCYFIPTFTDPAYGKNTGNDARTVAVEIIIDDGSIGFGERAQ
jgi:hypothetical protein